MLNFIFLFLLACAESKCAESCGSKGYTYQGEYRGAYIITPASCRCGEPCGPEAQP